MKKKHREKKRLGFLDIYIFHCSQESDSGARTRSRIPQQPNRLSPTRMSLPPAALTRSADRDKATDDESRPGYVSIYQYTECLLNKKLSISV